MGSSVGKIGVWRGYVVGEMDADACTLATRLYGLVWLCYAMLCDAATGHHGSRLEKGQRISTFAYALVPRLEFESGWNGLDSTGPHSTEVPFASSLTLSCCAVLYKHDVGGEQGPTALEATCQFTLHTSMNALHLHLHLRRNTMQHIIHLPHLHPPSHHQVDPSLPSSGHFLFSKVFSFLFWVGRRENEDSGEPALQETHRQII